MALSAGEVLLDARADPGGVLLVATGAVLYAGGVRRLAARGRRWPPARTAAAGGAAVALLAATCSGLATHEATSFGAHATQHALLALVAPLLLALAAPLTLALQASARPTQRGLLRLLHSRPATVATHPVVVWVVSGATLVALYTTPLYEATLRSGPLHALVHGHVLATGVLFCWTAVGLDPGRHRLPHGARLLFVLLAVPFHAVVGLALLDTPGRTAGVGVLWATGELFGLAAAGVVLAQWVRAEGRASARLDRRLAAAP